MWKSALLATLVFAALPSKCVERAGADIVTQSVSSPGNCGPFLKITASPGHDGLVAFTVRLDAEAAMHAGELYRGRVATEGTLKISSAESVQAVSSVVGVKAKGSVEFQFELAPQLAQHSVFTITGSLYEKNGMPTIGGGHVFQIHLNGFLPATPPR